MADAVLALNQVLRSGETLEVDEKPKQEDANGDSSSSVQVTCFTDLADDFTLHFQIIRLPNQIYAWIGCNSSKLGRLYGAAPTRPSNSVSVSSILGGVSDNTGSGIARRLVLKTGLNVIVACNIPKNSPMLEANAEKKLVEKLTSLGRVTECKEFSVSLPHIVLFSTFPLNLCDATYKADWGDLYLYNSLEKFVSMASFVNEQDGVARFISDAPPTHYKLKIQLFSLLVKNAVEKYESAEFEAGGYKWKLVLYPNGNKSKNVRDHISLYLTLANTSSLPLGWEVYAVVRLFLLDQSKDNYLTVQDATGKESHFHELKLECGFDHFVLLKEFNDASNGYLVEDKCEFGTEVFVTKERGRVKAECLSMVKDTCSVKHVWKIENFSKLSAEFCFSEVFSAGGQKWKIKLYPNGFSHKKGSHLSLFLALADFTPYSKIYTDYTLRLVDQLQSKHIAFKTDHCFTAASNNLGWPSFVFLSYLNDPGNGCLVKDICLVEAEVNVWGCQGSTTN
ncbi:hypothetical protein JRO89_XSUnG0199000 [Xanthoceras sorbifolium]|uniref:MATH domain-containing protein n=1 Tax=Xanthoceras sorbifolium TaxID=99658 RepID=A0ABQ8GXS4_9ROSI|nr:hypothetical protein JRO89_XSUnG0199000 [Xanthoceras sorbifolium]